MRKVVPRCWDMPRCGDMVEIDRYARVGQARLNARVARKGGCSSVGLIGNPISILCSIVPMSNLLGYQASYHETKAPLMG